MPRSHTDPDRLAAAIIDAVGHSIVLAIPLGLGKPNHIVNALVARAIAEPDLNLRILTALTLETPPASSELERRFLEPARDRLFGNYPPLAYADMLRNGTLPANIEVDEFFFLAGRWRGVRRAQTNYICANYTDVWRYILDRRVNLVAQLVAKRPGAGAGHFSLSCNPDITADLLAARRAGAADFLLVGQVNSELPYMSGSDVEVEDSAFAHMLESPETEFELYSAPKRPVALADHAVGLHVASLVPDGGTLQIGIGAIGDAIAAGLLLRHRDNAQFQLLASAVQVGGERACPCDNSPFVTGLYGASEMLTDGFIQLEAAGVLRREVDGAVAHAAFFVECRDFYKTLRDMPEAQRQRFGMRRVGFTNSLYGDVVQRRRDRVRARFINSAMMVTMLGAVVSDATEDGQVVSGVGGQFDFAEQAFALQDARFIITIKAVRTSRGKTVSNIVWSYGHATIPRHLRDVIVTEYGVADLRGKSDGDVIASLLNIADSRFQDELLTRAKAAGKIAMDYEVPAAFRNNTPGRIRAALGKASASGVLPEFPFGTDFTPVEQRLLPALDRMKQASHSKRATAALILRGAFARGDHDDDALVRMGLSQPRGPVQWIYRWMLLAALRAEAAERAG